MNIRLGVDPIPGLNAPFLLSDGLRDYLTDYGITHLTHAQNLDGEAQGPNYWYTAEDLHLAGEWVEKWSDFVQGLSHGGIKIHNTEDTLLWLQNPKNGMVTANSAYELIVSRNLPLAHHSFYTQIWHFSIPQKIKRFIWLVIKNKVNTWDNLIKRGWSGPNHCSLCKCQLESVFHLFVDCIFV